jgi:histone H3/H4
MAKKKTKKTAAKKSKAAPDLVVKSKCKEVLKGKNCNVAGDALDGLNMVVAWYLEQAATRAQANGRKTVRAHDFVSG